MSLPWYLVRHPIHHGATVFPELRRCMPRRGRVVHRLRPGATCRGSGRYPVAGEEFVDEAQGPVLQRCEVGVARGAGERVVE